MWRVALLLLACTEPQYVSGHLHCAASGRACPDDFYCGAGGLCWKNGTGPEMGAPDLGGVDLAGADFAGADLAVVDLAVPVDLAGADLTPLPDLAPAADLTGGNPSLCPGTFKICDGFEDATLNARWTQDTSGGTFTLDKSRFYRGSQSLHMHAAASPNAGTDPFCNLVANNLTLSGTAYVRAFFYFPSANYPGAFNQVLNFADATTNGTAFATKNGYPVLNDYSSPVSYAESTTKPLPMDQWVCLALSVSQSGTTGPVKLFIWDAEVTDVTFANAATPTMTHVYLGLDWVGNPAAFPATDVWMDEVVINDSPVSCSQ